MVQIGDIDNSANGDNDDNGLNGQCNGDNDANGTINTNCNKR